MKGRGQDRQSFFPQLTTQIDRESMLFFLLNIPVAIARPSPGILLIPCPKEHSDVYFWEAIAVCHCEWNEVE